MPPRDPQDQPRFVAGPAAPAAWGGTRSSYGRTNTVDVFTSPPASPPRQACSVSAPAGTPRVRVEDDAAALAAHEGHLIELHPGTMHALQSEFDEDFPPIDRNSEQPV